MDNADRDPEAQGLSAVDFRQSYVVNRLNIRDSGEAEAEDELIGQIDKVDAVRLQISKFIQDLSLVNPKPPALQKSIQNMELLERDCSALANKMRSIRLKIQEEEENLKQKIKNYDYSIEDLKEELAKQEKELETLGNANEALEQRVRILTEAARQRAENATSHQAENFKLEAEEMTVKVDDLSREVKELKAELLKKETLIHEKNANIITLNEELEKLLETADKSTQNKVRESLLANIHSSDSENEADDPNDPNYPAKNQAKSGLKKKQIEIQNEKLKQMVVDLKKNLESSTEFASKLQLEIATLKHQIDGSSPVNRGSIATDMTFDPAFLNMRNTDMLRSFQAMYLKEGNEAPAELPKIVEDEDPFEAAKKQESEKKAEPASTAPAQEVQVKKEIVYVPVETIVEVPVEKIVERVIEVNTGADAKAIRKEVEAEFNKEIIEARSKAERIREEANTKDLTISKLKEKISELEKSFGAEHKKAELYLKELEALKSEELLSHTPTIVPTSDLPVTNEVEAYRREAGLLKHKLAEVQLALSWYKRHSAKQPETHEIEALKAAHPPQQLEETHRTTINEHAHISPVQPLAAHPISEDESTKSTETAAKISHPSTENYPDQIALQPAEVASRESIQHTTNIGGQAHLGIQPAELEGRESVAQVVKNPYKDNVPVHPEQTSHSEESTTIKAEHNLELTGSVVGSKDSVTNSFLGQSAIHADKKVEEAKRIERIEAGLSNLSQSGFKKKEKTEYEEKLKSMNKEFSILQAKLKELKKAHDEVEAKKMGAQKDLELARTSKVEPKVMIDVEDRYRALEVQKNAIAKEIAGYVELEKQLKQSLSKLLSEVATLESGKAEVRASTLTQANAVLSETPPITPEQARKEDPSPKAPGHLDPNHLQVPHPHIHLHPPGTAGATPHAAPISTISAQPHLTSTSASQPTPKPSPIATSQLATQPSAKDQQERDKKKQNMNILLSKFNI